MTNENEKKICFDKLTFGILEIFKVLGLKCIVLRIMSSNNCLIKIINKTISKDVMDYKQNDA